jgi:tetratricopeptide (TPR) repeat protein
VQRRLVVLFLLAFAVPLRAEPSNPKLLELDRLLAQNDTRVADRFVQDWIKAEPKSPWPLVGAARVAYQQKRFKKGLSFVNKALNKWPQCSPAYFWRGRLYEALQRPLDAANEYRAALLSDDPYPAAQPELDRVLASLGMVNDSH